MAEEEGESVVDSRGMEIERSEGEEEEGKEKEVRFILCQWVHFTAIVKSVIAVKKI